jgi:hypothetical protein
MDGTRSNASRNRRYACAIRSMFAAKLALLQSARFKLHRQPLDLFSACSLNVQEPLRFQSFRHHSIQALKDSRMVR